MNPSDVAILVMAGGSSRRFGDDDKLLADLDGEPLGFRAAGRLAQFGWAKKLAVAHPSLAAGFEGLGYQVLPTQSANGLGDNLAVGANALGDVSGVVIILADMPFVTEALVQTILETAGSPSAIVCTQTSRQLMPPALIGRDYFALLRGLSGDQGAKAIFTQAGPHLSYIPAPASMTADIDTLDDYERVRAEQTIKPTSRP